MFAVVVLAMPAAAETVVYSQGFESGDGGYTHSGTNDCWQWGTPSTAYAQGPGGAHQGLYCWGTNLNGEVPKSSDMYLTSKAIAVPALSQGQIARVRFYGWFAMDYMYDRGTFQVSKDGVTWETKSVLLYHMSGAWTEYYFDISNYAGGNVYLRWSVHADGNNAYMSSQDSTAGLYVDDVAIVISNAPAVKTTLTLKAWEDQSAYASCPFVYSWNGTSFVSDNDIYSTARGAGEEYVDYYTLNAPVVEKDGQYSLQIHEVMDETSYTDTAKLLVVDHPAGVKVANDEKGNIWTYSSPSQPLTATDKNNANVLGQIATQDDSGVHVYNGDAVTLDFSNVDTSKGATLVLRAQGFQIDGDPGASIAAPPRIFIQTQDMSGNWVTVDYFYPRMEWATNAYDLSGHLTYSKLVRLVASSCNAGKYHVIDYVGLDAAQQAPITVAAVSPSSAVSSANGNVLGAISGSDNNYASMGAGENITMTFAVPSKSGDVRDFVFLSEGYYIPMGTFFIYTWDGSGWVQRDGWSIVGNGDQTRDFDLSLWLPDPSGQYKVRIWQDYWYEPAGIDYVGLKQGDVQGTLTSAMDLKKGTDVTSLLSAADGNKDNWENYDQVRNRWVELTFSGLLNNLPPTTTPITISNTGSLTPTISWTYSDSNGDPEVQYEVQAWTGSDGTGDNLLSSGVLDGATTSYLYNGTALTDGEVFYARVRAYDGTSWGPWGEIASNATAYSPPWGGPFVLPNPTWWYNSTNPFAATPVPTIVPTPVPTPEPTPVPTAAPTQTPGSGTGGNGTATATPTPTVAPTSTPVPSSSENTSLWSNNMWMLLVAVLVLGAIGTWYVTRHK